MEGTFMKIFGWVCIVLGALSFIGAASAGHSIFGPVFWLAVGVALVYFAKQREGEEKLSEAPSHPRHKEEVVMKHEPVKVKTYWEAFKENNPIKANNIETLLDLNFSELSNRDAREKVEMLERLSKRLGCSISKVKETYLKEIEQYPIHLIPQMIEATTKEIIKEKETFHIKENNTGASLIVKWLQERAGSLSVNSESYWNIWKRDNPHKAQALVSLTGVNFENMPEQDVKETIESFTRTADANNFSDWNSIKTFFLNKSIAMSSSLGEEKALSVFDIIIEQEAIQGKVKKSNTGSYYAKQWFEQYLKDNK